MAAAGHLASTVAGTTGSLLPLAGSTAPSSTLTPDQQGLVTNPTGTAGSAGRAGDAGSVTAADDDASTGDELDAGAADSGAANPFTTLFPPPPDAGPIDPSMCENLACFDIFDCALYHAAQFGPCKFTKCDGLICKP